MLSPTGWGALVGGGGLVGAGYAFGYPEAVVLGVGCLLAVTVALVWTGRPPRLAARRRVTPRKVARGDRAEGAVTLTHTGGRTRRGLEVVDRCGERPLVLRVPPLAAGAEHTVRYALPTERRGRIALGPLRLERTDPLGLARRVRVFGPGEGGTDALLVRPRVCPLPVLPSGTAHHVEGPTSDTADEGSLTFHALREYVLGDDLRRVHWRSTARTGTLMVKHLVDVSLPHTTLVLDTRRSAYRSEDDFELAVDSAASVAFAAARSHFPVEVLSETGTVLRTDGTGGDDAEALLDRLALVRRSEHASAAGAFDSLGQARRRGSLTVVTGTGDATGLSALERVRRRFDRTVVLRTGGGAEDDRHEPPALGSDVPQLRVRALDSLPAAWRREAVR
ncbi:DUF58 domain-containing protein [Streptomyces qinglanensis]|uniref:Uncharacterized conserved protein, DUF58 family, contains vWF domain n=1 Tax=Streptomyces qinglanensis TaxID=943816 RepID=A0A1H9SGB8_9ACTN|nr:DUF58 domain-containing protein [Streptomyces qinglanensis]SER83645.1 Uncharacterized conserved protein, DUF58 family, contains vWF domain [Streptomyces qinglanensis]